MLSVGGLRHAGLDGSWLRVKSVPDWFQQSKFSCGNFLEEFRVPSGVSSAMFVQKSVVCSFAETWASFTKILVRKRFFQTSSLDGLDYGTIDLVSDQLGSIHFLSYISWVIVFPLTMSILMPNFLRAAATRFTCLT